MEREFEIVTLPEINGGLPTTIPVVINGKKLTPQEAAAMIAANKGADPDTGSALPALTDAPIPTLGAAEQIDLARQAGAVTPPEPEPNMLQRADSFLTGMFKPFNEMVGAPDLTGPVNPTQVNDGLVDNLTGPFKSAVEGTAMLSPTVYGLATTPIAAGRVAEDFIRDRFGAEHRPLTPETYPLLHWLNDSAAQTTEWAQGIFPEHEPSTPLESAIQAGPISYTPVGKATGAATGIMAAIQGIAEHQIGLNPDIEDDSNPYAAMHEELRLSSFLDQQTAPFLPSVGPVRQPGEIREEDLQFMGILGLGTAALAGTGPLFRAGGALSQRIGAVRLRPEVYGPEGLAVLSDAGMVARLGDDHIAPILAYARKAGVAEADLATINQKAYALYGNHAGLLADTAIHYGRIFAPWSGGRAFRPIASIDDVSRYNVPHVNEYLHLRQLSDDFDLIHSQMLGAGDARLRAYQTNGQLFGLTEQQVRHRLTMLENTNPEVVEVARTVVSNNEQLWGFVSRGKFATMTREQQRNLTATYAHDTHAYRPESAKYDVPLDAIPTAATPLEAAGQNVAKAVEARVKNEVKGTVIEAIERARRGDRPIFRELSDGEYGRGDAAFRRNTIEYFRNGERIRLYTDDDFFADLLRIDPHAWTAPGLNFLVKSKSTFEQLTTGVAAPYFAVTSALRNYQMGKFTMENYNQPTALGTLAAIPQQVGPQLARAMSQELMHNGILQQVIPANTRNQMAQHLATVWEGSFIARAEAAGTMRGSVLQSSYKSSMRELEQWANRLGRSPNIAQHSAGAMLRGYMTLLNDVHNAPAFNVMLRDLRHRDPQGFAVRGAYNAAAESMMESARTAREAFGSPLIQGGTTWKDGNAVYHTRMPPRYVTDAQGNRVNRPVVDRIAEYTAMAYADGSEVARQVVPYFNITEQSIKVMAQAFARDPARFMTRTWLYIGVPSAIEYSMNAAAGPEQLDYFMNGRSEWQSGMEYFIPQRYFDENAPIEQGIRVPLFHEVTPFRQMFLTGLYDLYGNGDAYPRDQWDRIGRNFMGNVVTPAVPPALGAAFGSAGISSPQGPFGGGVYPLRSKFPFSEDEPGQMWMQPNQEAIIRALGGSTADLFINGIIAYERAVDEEGMAKAAWEGLEEVGRRGVAKTPLLRDVMGQQQIRSISTAANTEMWEYRPIIDQLLNFYKYNHEPTKASGGSNRERPTDINTKAPSSTGGEFIDLMMGTPGGIANEYPSPPRAGGTIEDAARLNPRYLQFIRTLDGLFGKDKIKPEAGQGMGWLSAERRYTAAGQFIRGLDRHGDSNIDVWQEYRKDPIQVEIRAEMEAAGVDPDDRIAVRNYYQEQRDHASRVMMRMIKLVEAKLSSEWGEPVALRDINPYDLSGQTPIEVPAQQ